MKIIRFVRIQFLMLMMLRMYFLMMMLMILMKFLMRVKLSNLLSP